MDGLCRCSIGQHFDETELICLNNTLIDSSCTSNRTCDSLIGLSCQDSKCQCDFSKKYWSYKENKCVNLLSYGETSCYLDKECIGNLKCNYGMCNCGSTTLNEMYWNGSYCVQAGGKWAKCEKDYQCKSPYICLNIIFSRCSTNFFMSDLLRSDSACLKMNKIYFFLSFFLVGYIL